MSIREVEPEQWIIKTGPNSIYVTVKRQTNTLCLDGADYRDLTTAGIDDLITTLLLARERIEARIQANAASTPPLTPLAVEEDEDLFDVDQEDNTDDEDISPEV